MGQTCTQRQAKEIGAIWKPRQVVSLDDICQLQAQHTKPCEEELESISERWKTLEGIKRKQAPGKIEEAVGSRTEL